MSAVVGALHSSLTPGQIFAGGFRVERPLSAGGMGSVYVVTQLNTQRQRALKVMHPELAQRAKFQERFRQEAQVGAQILSDHIVEVVDAGVDAATGMPYLAMELLDGADLADTVEQRGPLPPEEVATIFEQLCHALAAAHRANIVHRDLKPENLFLAKSRRADSDWILKILDFGIAKMVAEAQTASKATQSIGSPLWMAPEQTVAGSRITSQTDLWPLGLIAFYLLTGRAHWRAANEETVEQMRLLREIAFEPLVYASVRANELGVGHLLPAGFDEWFARCVAREPGQRFGDADEVLASLLPLLRTGPAQRLSAPGSNPQAFPIAAPLSADVATGEYAPGLVEAPVAAPHAPALPVTQAGVPPQMTVPGAAAPPAAPPQHIPPQHTPPQHTAPQHTAPEYAAAPMPLQPASSSKLPLVAALLVALVAMGAGAFFVLRTPESESDTVPPLFEDKPIVSEVDEPNTDKPSAIDPDEPKPDEKTAASDPTAQPTADPPPQPIRPTPTGRWPTPKPKPKPPPPPPPPKPVVRPPPPRPPPSMYGRPCKSRADCGPGFDCSYGGKCVRI